MREREREGGKEGERERERDKNIHTCIMHTVCTFNIYSTRAKRIIIINLTEATHTN